MERVYNFNYSGKKEFSKQYSEGQFRKLKAQVIEYGMKESKRFAIRMHRIFCSKVDVVNKESPPKKNLEAMASV